MTSTEKITLSVMVLDKMVADGTLDDHSKVIATELIIELCEKLAKLQ